MSHTQIPVVAMCLLMLAGCADSGAGGNANTSGGGMASVSTTTLETDNDVYDMATEEERRLDAVDENERLASEHRQAVREHREFCAAHANDASCDNRLSP